jgi:hypothetical protein
MEASGQHNFMEEVSIVIIQSILSQIPRKVRNIGITTRFPVTATSIGYPHILGVEGYLPQGRHP